MTPGGEVAWVTGSSPVMAKGERRREEPAPQRMRRPPPSALRRIAPRRARTAAAGSLRPRADRVRPRAPVPHAPPPDAVRRGGLRGRPPWCRGPFETRHNPLSRRRNPTLRHEDRRHEDFTCVTGRSTLYRPCPNSHVPVAACRSVDHPRQEARTRRGNRQPENQTGAPRVSHGGRGLKQRRRGLFWSLPARPKAGVTEEATTSLPACGRVFPSKPWQQRP